MPEITGSNADYRIGVGLKSKRLENRLYIVKMMGHEDIRTTVEEKRRVAEYEPIYIGASRGSNKITARGLRFVFANADIGARPMQIGVGGVGVVREISAPVRY